MSCHVGAELFASALLADPVYAWGKETPSKSFTETTPLIRIDPLQGERKPDQQKVYTKRLSSCDENLNNKRQCLCAPLFFSITNKNQTVKIE
jgi:hypothetical protein